MTQEEKQLLLKDLAARVPYGLMIDFYCNESRRKSHFATNLIGIEVDDAIIRDVENNGARIRIDMFCKDCNIKPYLRPLSSMSGDEIYSVAGIVIPGLPHNIDETKGTCSVCCNNYTDEIEQDFSVRDLANGIYGIEGLDWLNEHHFDYRCLIKKGLALEAPKGMYTKNE